MELIFENRFSKMFFEQNTYLITDIWQAASSEMTGDEFKRVLEQWRNLAIKYQAKRALVDARHMQFTVPPELQEWVAREVSQIMLKKGLTKSAILLPSSLFEKISLQQIVREHKNKKEEFSRRYYEDEILAREWLLM